MRDITKFLKECLRKGSFGTARWGIDRKKV